MTASEGDKVPSQHNHGTGIFISGDNFGDMVDEKTKALLEKMAKQSPKLAKLLEQAFQDGFISPEAVAGMERAARSINEDVAVSLQTAAKNINEDVAFVLADAARKIASHVDPLTAAADILSGDVHTTALRLEDTASQIRSVRFDDDIQKIESAVRRLERAEVGPCAGDRVTVTNWRAMGWAFLVGICLGAIGALRGADILKAIFDSA